MFIKLILARQMDQFHHRIIGTKSSFLRRDKLPQISAGPDPDRNGDAVAVLNKYLHTRKYLKNTHEKYLKAKYCVMRPGSVNMAVAGYRGASRQLIKHQLKHHKHPSCLHLLSALPFPDTNKCCYNVEVEQFSV